MTKLRLHILAPFFLLYCVQAAGQGLYPLRIDGVDKDSNFIKSLGVKTIFNHRNECVAYIDQLPQFLLSLGYVTASVDSALYDSLSARLSLYIGNRYEWAQLNADAVDPNVLQAIGWRDRVFSGKAMDFSQVNLWQEKILNHMENTGYPFAKVELDSLQVDGEKVWAKLRLEKGPSYKVDSIRVLGDTRISNEFLQRYLEIRNGSLYNKEKLLRVSSRIRELTYME
ncbi:MAG TPA: POTRA domain-containing protein [Chitinophagaceae bacterium]|nr:POTRA domain-containing protein [Chitinophagaceae bacterium]